MTLATTTPTAGATPATRARAGRHTIAALAVGGVLVAVLVHALLRVPIAYGDQFDEIVLVYTWPLGDTLAHYVGRGGDFFRPLEYVLRYAIAFGFGQGVWGYNLFQAGLLSATMAGFVLLCRPRDGRDLTACLVALAVLFGHQAMQGTWELNIVFSNGVVLALMVAALAVLGSGGGLLVQIAAVLVAATAILTKEIGLVVPGVLVLGWMLGMPGMRRWTAGVVTLLVLAYLAYRFGTLPDITENTKDGKAAGLVGYLSNMAATFVMFWLGPPQDGEWTQLLRFASHPWRWIQGAAGLVTAALLFGAWRLRPTGAEQTAAAGRAPVLDGRWLLLFGAALAACCALGFYYTRHRHGAPAVPLLAWSVYLGMRVVLWRLDAGLRPAGWVVLAAVAVAAVWPLRVVAGFEYARGLGANIRANWAIDLPIYRDRAEPKDRPFLEPFARSVDEMPWAVQDVPVLRLLGHKDVVNR